MTASEKWEFNHEEWKSRFVKVVSGNHLALKSLETLKKTGVDVRDFAEWLPFCCDVRDGPGSMFVEKFRVAMLERAKRSKKLAKRLDADRAALAEYKTIHVIPPDLCEKLSEAAIALRSDVLDIRKFFSKHKANTDVFLAFLISSAEEKTGRPHYREISHLLHCAYEAFGSDVPNIDADDLRKTYALFKKDNPFAMFTRPEVKKELESIFLKWALTESAPGGRYPHPELFRVCLRWQSLRVLGFIHPNLLKVLPT